MSQHHRGKYVSLYVSPYVSFVSLEKSATEKAVGSENRFGALSLRRPIGHLLEQEQVQAPLPSPRRSLPQPPKKELHLRACPSLPLSTCILTSPWFPRPPGQSLLKQLDPIHVNQPSWPMSDTAEGTRAAAAPNAVDRSPSPTNIARHGHEPSRIAQPSTFLLPRGQNRAMQDKPLSSVDRDQLSGLVSLP